MVNVVVTPARFERQRELISGTPLLLVRGVLQVEQGVVNVRGARFLPLALGGGEQFVAGRDYR
jgi:hypothetical protein